MKFDGRDTYTLRSGRSVYANRGILGIDPSLDGISEGYDGGVCTRESHECTMYSMSILDQIEIAEYAIQLWTQYLDKLKEVRE